MKKYKITAYGTAQADYIDGDSFTVDNGVVTVVVGKTIVAAFSVMAASIVDVSV